MTGSANSQTERQRVGQRPIVRDIWWVAVFVLASALLLAALFDAVWRIVVDEQWVAALSLPVAALFWFWLAGGAWRRTTWGRPTSPQD